MSEDGPEVSYAIEYLPGGDRIIRSVGLYEMDQREICARVAGYRDHNWDHEVTGVLNFVARYIITTGARVLPNQTVTYGWTSLRFVERTPALLEAHEIEDVYSESPQPAEVAGVDRAIRLAQAADDVMRRNGLPGTGDFPHRGKLALTCVHLPQVPLRQFFMERVEPNNPDDSGWVVDCGVKSPEHDTTDIEPSHLAHVALRRPFLVPYLTMPTGCAVAFDREGAIVFPAGGDKGRRDPADPYGFGPSSLRR